MNWAMTAWSSALGGNLQGRILKANFHLVGKIGGQHGFRSDTSLSSFPMRHIRAIRQTMTMPHKPARSPERASRGNRYH